MMRQALLASLLLAALAGPASANCAETYMDTKEMAVHYQRGFATLKVGPDAAYVDRLDLAAGKLYLTPAFEALPASAKQGLLERAVGALYAGIPADVREVNREQYGAIAVAVRVVDPAGRILYRDTPCSGSYVTLTEHQRYTTSFSISIDEDGARYSAAPPKVALKRLRAAFHGVMSWKPAYYLAWAPEAGRFEVDVPGKGDLARLKRFWPQAPRGFAYDVRANDGTLLTTVRR